MAALSPRARHAAMLAAALVAASLSGAACDSAVEPLPEFTLVHSVLLAGADTARVRLERVDSDTGIRSMVPDAHVTLAAGTGEVVTLPWVPGPPCVEAVTLPLVGRTGCYLSPLPRRLSVGSEYGLSVDFADGVPPVTGRVRIPLSPRFRLLEEPWMRFPLAHPFIPVRLEWESDPVVGRIEARLEYLRGHRRDGGWSVDDCSLDMAGPFVHDPRMGPAEIRIRSIGCDSHFDWDSMHVRLVSTAYDTAYARYARLAGASSFGIPAGQAAAGLEGALGLFGAAATSVGEFFVLRERPPD